MFSNSINSTPGNTVGRSRRRPRPLSTENSVAQPKAKRLRSTLNDQTFIPPNDVPEMQQVRPDAPVATLRNEAPVDLSNPMQELTVRTKKRRVANDRIAKGDGSTNLTANEVYTVSKLPALPGNLGLDSHKRQHGAIYSDSGYALSLSQTHAVVWPYSVNSVAPETFTFTLPQSSKTHTDALPLGTLVSASASEHEPGLVVVMPATGKICYWESISSAATLDLIRKKQNGLEASVPGMMSAETVVQIMNAETAGFVLAFSSGRLAYMSVRDGQGRPAINVQFLQTGSLPRGGIFGSVRNLLGVTSGGDIAAIRAGPSTKIGERDVVMATSKGKLQAWELHRGGHNILRADMELREYLLPLMKIYDSRLIDLSPESFAILDLTFSPKPAGTVQSYEGEVGEEKTNLMLFTSMSNRERSFYNLVEITLGSMCEIARIIPISSYTTHVNHTAISQPKLYWPSPALVAFLVFDRSVVVVSMARQPGDPEMQLANDASRHAIKQSDNTFEDVVDFRDDLNLEIIGSGEEEPYGHLLGEDHKSRKHRAKFPGAVLLVKGGGLIRIAVTNTDNLLTKEEGRLSAKSKLEQAVFFRILENNPLSFTGRPELQFHAGELGRAALELSRDIIDSKTSHVPSVSAALDQHLVNRAKALRSLADHLKEMKVVLNRATRWGLMADAEKLNGALLMWRTYETAMKSKPVGEKQRLLSQIVEFIREDQKTEPAVESGEVDRVRFWFLNDISRIFNVIPWTFQAVRLAAIEEWEDSLGLAKMLVESQQYVISVMGGAYDFRSEHLELYGLQNERLKHGIVQNDLESLPQPWTGTKTISATVLFVVRAARSALAKPWSPDNGPELAEVLDALAASHPELVNVTCKSLQEHYRWNLAQKANPERLEMGRNGQLEWMEHREELIFGLSGYNQTDRAIELAVQHEVMPAIAELVYLKLATLNETMQSQTSTVAEKDRAMADFKETEATIESLYRQFGDRFATAVFEHFANTKNSHQILVDSHKQYVTRFLRSRKEFAKIAWINEVKNEKNIAKGAEMLLEIGAQEQELWSKKVELSIGKLARFASGQGYSQIKGLIIPDGGQADLVMTNKELALIKIQEQVYEWVFPVISSAIDEKAGLELAVQTFGNTDALKTTKVFPVMVQTYLEHLIAHKSQPVTALIDLLTLMETPEEEAPGIQFYLALKAVNQANLSPYEQALNERLIWRRCLIRDDWSEVNNTVLKDDKQTVADLGRTALFSTLKACFEDRMFSPPSSLQPRSPEEVLGACSDPEELGLRFADREDSAKAVLAADMRTEDEKLEGFMRTCQLERWWQDCVDTAEKEVAAEVHAKTVEGAKMQSAEEEVKRIEEEHFREQKKKALENSRALAPSGKGLGMSRSGGLRSSGMSVFS